MNKGLLLLLALLSGCAPNPYFRTEIGATPCLADYGADCSAANLVLNDQDDYALGFVEFDDKGRFYDPRQAETLLNWLNWLNWLNDGSQPQYVAIYTHGWHHNARDTDINVRRFKQSLRDIKQRNPHYRVVGVYLGWRGETLSLPWLRALTFWDRKAVSEQLGHNQLLDFLLRVERVVKHDNGGDNRLLTIGHSLGASVIFNALQPVWLSRLSSLGNQNAGFGDLVLLVNPAFEAKRFAGFRSLIQQAEQQHKFVDQHSPLLVVASSEADTITKEAFTWSRAVPAWFESLLEPAAETATQGASQWALAATAVGHFQGYITHRLEATDPFNITQACTAGQAVDTHPPSARQHIAGPIWTLAGGAVWRVAEGLQLRSLASAFVDDPLWVVQTDKYILPNHGFMGQKPFWCFIERTMDWVAG